MGNKLSYDEDKLKVLVTDAKKMSVVRERIKEAISNDPYFRDRSKISVANVIRALRDRTLLDGIVKDTKGVTSAWDDEKKDSFRKDFSDSSNRVNDIARRYGLKNDTQTRNVAKNLGVEREKIAGTRQGTKKIFKKAIYTEAMELIESGILLEKDGFDKLHEKIAERFPENGLNKERFEDWVYDLIFVQPSQKQKRINKDLQDIVRMGLKREAIIEEFLTIYPIVPNKFAQKRMNWHKGLVSGRAKKFMSGKIRGLGRINLSDGNPNFKIPRTSFERPFHIKTKDSGNWPVMVLNGTNLGLQYDIADIVENIPRRALSDAEARKDKAVILTNFLCFDLKKAGGPAKTARSQILGDNINPELIQDNYYRKIVESIIAKNPMDKVAYRPTEELVNDILGGWIKICTIPKEESKSKEEGPEYSGPIYVVIGLNELALIFAVTYWEIRIWTILEQKRLDNEIKVLKKSVKKAENDLGKAEGAGEDVADFRKNLRLINKKLDSLEYQRAITIISNVASQESRRFFKHAYSVVVKRIEQAIPNSKVIGEGTSFFKINNKIIKIHIPSHLRVTDGLLNTYCSDYGPDVLRGENPDAVVICHPSALQFRATGRESDHDGKRDSMKVYVAPIAVDDDYLRSELTNLRSKDHPVMKAVYDQTFKAGVLRLRCANGRIIDADEISVEALESFKNYPKPKISKKINGAAVYKYGPKNIWIMCASDQHWGGRSKEFVWDKKTGIRLSMAEAVFEMMRREDLCKDNKMPIHLFASPDDPTQGQNHKYRTEPHPRQMSYKLIETITANLLTKAVNIKNRKAALEAAEKIRKLALFQFEKRGVDYVFDQMMEMMQRHIEPNVDVFSAILKRAQSAGIIIKGVGDLSLAEYGRHDSRNIGIINIGTGDRHFSKTLDFELIEGPFYAQRLRDLLCQLDEWKDKKELIEKLVVSPIYGQTCIGWGVISVKGKHEYGFEVRSAPTNMAGWGDPLRGHVKKDLQRGNYSRIWNGKLPVIKIFGDKHFFSGVSASYTIYHMSPASVHTDAYGESGFPPNNTGVSFLGVPSDGPDSGPIFWRTLPFDVIKDFMEDNPRPFDWDEFLPNPA